MRLETISEQKPTGLATPCTPLGCLPTHSAPMPLLLPAALVSVSHPRLFAHAQLSFPPQVRLAASTPSLHPYPALSELSAARTLTSPNAVSARSLPQTPVSSGVGHVSNLGDESFSPELPSIPSPDPCPPAPFPTTRSHHGQLVKVTLAVLGHCCHWLGQDLIRKREAGPQLPVPHLPAGLGASDSTPPRRLRAAPSHRGPLSGAPASFRLRPQTSEVAWAPLSLMPHTPRGGERRPCPALAE